MAEVQAVNSSRALREAETRELATHPGEDLEDFVTFRVKKQLFGIPVLMVQDILSPDRIASIPLAPPEVRGSINLRGRIVTVIDVRVRLGLPSSTEASENAMAVTVEHEHELYTLLVDSLSNDLYERNPATLDSLWREFANGIYRLKGELMVVLDVHRLLNISVRP